MCTWCTLFLNPSHFRTCITHWNFGRALLNVYLVYTFLNPSHFRTCIKHFQISFWIKQQIWRLKAYSIWVFYIYFSIFILWLHPPRYYFTDKNLNINTIYQFNTKKWLCQSFTFACLNYYISGCESNWLTKTK